MLAVGILTGYLAYWSSRRSPNQEWHLRIALWKEVLDATTVSLVHALIAAIFTVAIFVLLQRGFEGLVVDAFIGTTATSR